MSYTYKNSVVWQWASDARTGADAAFDEILRHVRSRRDMPHRFPNTTYMKNYLARTGCPTLERTNEAWQSYFEYDNRVSRPGLHTNGPATSRAEARRSGRPTFDGAPCSKGHGTLRRTANGECVVCRKLYNKNWQRQRNNVVEIEVPPMTEEELEIARAAMTATRRRA